MPRRLPFLCLSALALLAARSAAQEAEWDAPVPAAAPEACDWRSGGCAAAPGPDGGLVISPSAGLSVSGGEDGGLTAPAWGRQFVARGGTGSARFISYDALKRDRVPCSQPGHSYYNCRDHGRANPYRRGCTAITRCARYLD